MSYEFYKILHITGVVAIFMGLGAMLLQAMTGGSPKFPQRRWVMLFHGVGMLAVLVAGFGLMARSGVPQSEWPLWIKGKFLVWLAAGGISAAILRINKRAKVMWFVVLLIAFSAIALAVLKPV